MMTMPLLPLLLAAAMGPVPVSTAGSDPLAAHRWTHRVVVALASSPDDPGLATQRRILRSLGREAAQRDLVLVEATDATPEGRALRRRFGGGRAFRAVLVGKDGGEKLSSATPIEGAALKSAIDAMPMRQDEMRRSGEPPAR